jgi:glycolate oxidase iron-sulfur subunit
MYAQLPRLQPAARPLPKVLPAKGERRARVGLFTGCVAEAMFSQTNRATARVLQEQGCEVVVPSAQVCCGAIHYHSGHDLPALQFARRNAEAFLREDLDAIVVNVAGCGAMLKDYSHLAEEAAGTNAETIECLRRFAGQVRDVSEFLSELGPLAPRGDLPVRAVYHDACHLCHAQRIRNQPRELLALIPGLELIPLAESEICCGAAGSYNLTEPEMSERLSRRKLANILATEPDVVVSGNAGCTLQIQAALRKAGKDIPVLHPMELLDRSFRNLSLESRAWP